MNSKNPTDEDPTEFNPPTSVDDPTRTEFGVLPPDLSPAEDRRTLASEGPTIKTDQPTVPSPLSGESDDLTGQRLMNRYRIGKKLGSGGFGSVYRAVDELKQSGGEDAEIAIKAMDADQIGDRLGVLVQEVSRSHRVSHPNILRVYDIHVDRGLAFITMELLEGETLGDRIAGAMLEKATQDSFLPISEVDTLARSLCSALGHCHDQDLVHADVKPANIFICSNGVVKLLDLGISQLVGVRGKVVGYSTHYASPQQISGELADPKDDLFSVGCVLYRCLTGEHAFRGKSAKDAFAEGLSVDLTKLPRRYRRSIAAALSFTRERRIESARKLWNGIDPTVRRRNGVFAILAVIAASGFLAANQIGNLAGKEAIAVSTAHQQRAETLVAAAIGQATHDAGAARASLVEALQLNPYNEEAAGLLAAQVRRAEYTNPALFSEIWADFAAAIEASPKSESLVGLARKLTDALLLADPSEMTRSRVLSEFRAPLCVLPMIGYRSDELGRMRSSLSIRC